MGVTSLKGISLKYRALGKSGLQVSEIGFGAWGIGGSWWGGRANDEAALNALRKAVDVGVNFFDTALAYGEGHSERLIGRLCKETKQPIYLASKIPPENRQWPARHGSPVKESFSAAWIRKCVEASLKNLGLERLDLIQFHVWSDSWLAQKEEWLPAIERLKKDGKIRLWGVSINDHEPESALDLVRSGLADTVQVIFNIFDQSPADNLFPLCREKGVGVIVRVPLDEGSLSGVFTPETRFDPEDFRRNYFAGDRLIETLKRVEKLRFLVGGNVKTLAQAALKFCLSHPAVSTVIPGMRKPSRVEENARVSDGNLFSQDTLQKLKSHAWRRNFYR